MKIIEPKTSRQLSASAKRYKKGGHKPYRGPYPARHIYGMDCPRLPLKFDPIIYAELCRW